MPAPRIRTFLPIPDPAGSFGGPSHASIFIQPIAVITSWTATEPPSMPTISRNCRLVQDIASPFRGQRIFLEEVLKSVGAAGASVNASHAAHDLIHRRDHLQRARRAPHG